MLLNVGSMIGHVAAVIAIVAETRNVSIQLQLSCAAAVFGFQKYW